MKRPGIEPRFGVCCRCMGQQLSNLSQGPAGSEQAPVSLGLHLLQSGAVVVFAAVLGQGEVAEVGVEPGAGDPLDDDFFERACGRISEFGLQAGNAQAQSFTVFAGVERCRSQQVVFSRGRAERATVCPRNLP